MNRPSVVVERVSEKLFLHNPTQVSLCYPTVAIKSMDAPGGNSYREYGSAQTRGKQKVQYERKMC